MTDTVNRPSEPTTDIAILEAAPGVKEAFLALVDAVPEAGGDAYSRIVAQILAAESVDDLDAPWQANSLRLMLNRPIRVDTIRRMPSDFTEGLGFFLVLDGVELDTGERITATTGSVAIVAQLVRAHSLGELPLTVIARASSRPSANGYTPLHLEMVRGQRTR